MFAGVFGTRHITYEMDDWAFTESTARERLYKHFAVKNLKGFGVDHLHSGVVAAGVVMQYLEQTQHSGLDNICTLSRSAISPLCDA